MKHLRDLAFVIKRINFSDSDRFITLFTKGNGKVEVLAKGVRKINSRRSYHIELLNFVQFQAIKTRKNFILTDIEVIDTFSQLKQEYEKVGMIFLICELIDKLCAEGVKHEDIFFLMKNTLDNLKKKSDSLLNFQTQLLTLLGFWNKNRSFSGEKDIDRYIESLIEKKIKTKTVFKI